MNQSRKHFIRSNVSNVAPRSGKYHLRTRANNQSTSHQIQTRQVKDQNREIYIESKQTTTTNKINRARGA